MTSHFSMRWSGPNGGLYYTNSRGSTTRIAFPAFEIIPLGDRCSLLLRWKSNGHDIELEVSKAMLSKGRGWPLCGALADKGLNTDTFHVSKFIRYLKQQMPTGEITQ